MANRPKTQARTLVNSVAGTVLPIVQSAQGYALAVARTTKGILDAYPPVKAFVYTLGGAAAIPLAVFTTYGAATGAIVVGVAGTGVALVQGGFLAFGGFVLFWFLLGALIFAAISAFWFTVAYFAYQVAKRLEGSPQQTA
ncbi:uncharacterized protein EV422DRAFT_540464 [Fimicolochytrium jonesii]|uniref:uncharacterized protein n=1 Tax=Fimicolochytrium jonesii TaxID=1396493 RepID=UPI0022FF43A4|nr:uncharacterized protein EV422DRAFT_540464 [Fimicolochytrium jonesii]KAI8817664.1 hypothetical protein EV422DRAFT_540464 [Fimicolochytrium jonesii]